MIERLVGSRYRRRAEVPRDAAEVVRDDAFSTLSLKNISDGGS
ncbi:MAG: hypothetical protein ACRDE9_02590 [Candidatus Limnocylindria bacterium]